MTRVLIAGSRLGLKFNLGTCLENAGCEVSKCKNAGEMMQTLSDSEFDVIVAGAILSKTPWMELSQSVRAAAPNIQIVLVTSKPDYESARRAFSEGVFDYLEQSASQAQFLKSITNAARFKKLNAERHALLEDNSRYLGYLQEILQQKTTAFHASESRWRTLIDTIPDLVWLKDMDGKYLACNRRFEQFIGAKESEIIGKTDSLIEDESRAAMFREQDEETVHSRKKVVSEVDVTFASDGHTEFLETVKVPMYLPDGTQIGMLGVGRNITRRRELQSLTKTQADLAEALLELSKIAEQRDESALLSHGLSIVEKSTQSRLSFFCFVEDKHQTLELAAFSDRESDRGNPIPKDLAVPVQNSGDWAKLFENQEAVLLNDYLASGFEDGLLADHAQFTRIIIVPIVENGKVVMLAGAGNKIGLYTKADVETLRLIAIEIRRLVELDRSLKTVNRFSRVLERSLSEIFIFDSKSLRFVDTNQGARINLGFSAVELTSMTPLDINPHYTQDAYDKLLEPLRSGSEKEITTTSIHCRKDGTKYPVEISLQLIDEDPPVFVAIAHDIDERVRMEDELRKLAQAVEQSPESIVITNRKAEIEYINEAFVQTSGYSREELIGKNPSIKKSDKTPRETFDGLWNALRQGLPWKGELYNRRKDGSEYIEMAHIAPISMPDGTVTHYLGVLEDITEKMILAEELDQHRNHLEHLVEERTELLLDAQKQAEAANQAKSAFLAMMSHEIRTPINAIVGLTHLLKRSDPNPEQAERLGKIEASAEFLMSIINDILDLSKIEAGKLLLEESEFKLEGIMNHIDSLFSEQARAKGLSMEFDISEVPFWIRGDQTRLRHALLNYVNNAIKFSSKGTIKTRVRMIEDNGKDLLLRFEVVDQGIGIEPEKIPLLFNDFEQADVSTTREFGGTGLGLAITLRLARLMGGDAGAESLLGKGSTFWFTANVKRGQGTELDVSITPIQDSETEFKEKYQGAKILLVEDNAINREVAVALLEEMSLDVHTARNGQEAVEMTRETSFELILMDLQMPEMDGLEATRLIRSRETGAQIPILAMTANVFSDDRQSCTSAGMNDFVSKPVDPQNLYSTMAKWLAKPSSEAGEIVSPDNSEADVENESSILINPQALERIFGDDTAARNNILQAFQVQAADCATIIDEAYAQHEAEKIIFQAHKLKSSARTVGADTLADLCLALELAGREENWEDIDRLVPEMAPLVERLHATISAQE